MTKAFHALFVAAIILATQQSQLPAAPLELVSEGKSPYVILVGASANITERHAASELQKYFKQITGAELPIVTDAGEAPCISVGATELAAEITVPSRYEWDDGFRIRTVGRNLVIKGAHPRGTLFGLFAFLESQGCWWFAPDCGPMKGNHEIVPEKPAWTLQPLDVLEQPLMKYRRQDPGASYGPNDWPALFDWMAKNRANTLALHRSIYERDRDRILPELVRYGMHLEAGKHGIMLEFLPPEKYFQDHPEWFGMIQGERVLRDKHDRNRRVVFETANPEAVAAFERNLIAYLRTRPEINVFQLWPPDSCNWSESPESLALGSPSERIALLVQRIAKAGQEAGLRTRISFIAYHANLPPPENMNFDERTIVEFCPIHRDYSTPINDPDNQRNVQHHQYLLDWLARFPGEVTHYSYYSKGTWRSLPVAQPEQIADEMKYWRKIGEVGVNLYNHPEDWLAREVNRLSFARAAWDPDFNGAEWYDAYLKARFGRAAEAMRNYYAAGTKITLGALVRESAKGDVADYEPLLHKARKAMREARELADTPNARWAVGKLAWQPDYLAGALKLQAAIEAGKPMKEINALRKELAALQEAHQGDGTLTGVLFRGR